ncbi:vezatin-like isoform X1 [Carassius auratus]|uniref:Vezatin n=1 Tax=Carassius auratus TaxID=7957 RepID=A0A6P6LRB9_CARAU|nr:vezatin-like isoform X1 [Carassius auratus]XP_052410199.1 vezatin isoform X1 [Carassius gibelio]
MTEDFDEEIVFENSPLFQYLQDLGHTDFEACSPVSQEEEPSAGGEEAQFPQDILPSHRKGGVWRLVDVLHSLNPLRRDSATHWQEQQLDAAFRQYSLRCLLSQDVLLQEDVELIELLDPSVLSLGSTDTVCPSASTSVPAPRYLSPPSIWDVSVLVGLLAVLLGVCFSYPDHERALWLCGVLVCVTCVCRGLSLWRKAVLQRRVQSLAVQLEGLVNNSRALTSLSRKSLRLIQETEVISRGFTLLLDRVSGACPFNRAGLLRSQQLIGLRKAAYQSLRCAFRASRIATCIMLKSFPLNSEIDNVTNYVSTVPIRELGLGLGVEHLSDDQAQELTNDYSLPALKMLFQLWVGQSSEFFRRLALLLSPGREELDSKPSPLTYSSVPLITDSLHRTLATCLRDLQRSFDFHRYFETQHQSLPSERNGRAQQKCRELNALHTSVRSLQLHLKTLLNEVIILEDDLEKLMVAKETEEMTCAGYQELKERLQLLQPHMQASTCCWDDTLAQVDRMLRRVSSCPESSDQPEETAVPDPPPPAPFTHIQDRDPVPEEQELEAYVSDSDSETEWRGVTDMLSPWEQERQRREREESRRVLLELKSVLGIRTSDGERDKRKLLLFSDQAALAPFAKDTSETDTNSLEPHISAESVPTTENHVSQPGEENECEPQTEILSEAEGERDSVTEFCCGDSDVTGAAKDTRDETAEETQLFQSDGLIEEGHDGTHPLTPRVPTLSVIDRLTELHGSEAISFSSALAAQVAARSHTFTHMQECTYEDSEEEEEVTSPQKRETDED